MRVLVLDNDNKALTDLIVEALKDIDETLEIDIVDDESLVEQYDGALALSILRASDLETLMDNVNCGMVLSGASLKSNYFPSLGKKVKDFDKRILWREKFHYKDALKEFYSRLR